MIVNNLITILTNVVNWVLTPLNNIINNYLPSLSNAFSTVNSFFDKLGSYVPWVMSYTGITQANATILLSLITFILTVPFLVSSIKLVIKWISSFVG